MGSCKCSLSISLVGDRCRYCQPQEYIDRLEECLNEECAEIARLNHQHANDEAANQMLSDACANMRERTILECAASFRGGCMRNNEISVNDAEEIILALLEK